jgi:hypothetical protein
MNQILFKCPIFIYNLNTWPVIYIFHRISNLILADPWGYGILSDISVFDKDYVSPWTGQPHPWWIRLLASFPIQFNPFALYRFFGRLSIYVSSGLRSDLVKPYNILWKNKTDNALYLYINHCILHTPRYTNAVYYFHNI